MTVVKDPTSGLRAVLAAWLLGLFLTPPPAHANPHVWVESRITFEIGEDGVRGFTFTWRFDDYYSTHAIRFYDINRDGVLGPDEMQALRAGTFDPLAGADYHVHVWAGQGRRQGHSIDRFTARVEESRLVVEFVVPVTPPADPREAPVVVSLFDPRNVVDFSFRKSQFLSVAGVVKPGCKFWIARGRGEQSGHPQPVTFRCGA